MAEPELLILDEPSLGLSPLLVDELFALININAQGIALIGRTERRTKSGNWRKRAYILENGQFVIEGSASQHSQGSRSQARIFRDVTMADTETLRSRLDHKPMVVAPGVYDPLPPPWLRRRPASQCFTSRARRSPTPGSADPTSG